jgi:hypothetical protein
VGSFAYRTTLDWSIAETVREIIDPEYARWKHDEMRKQEWLRKGGELMLDMLGVLPENVSFTGKAAA